MADRKPTSGMKDDGRKGAPDGVNNPGTMGRKGKGESDGGPYPNPHTGKSGKAAKEGYGSHGGQSEIAYHGPEQLGEKNVEPGGNKNAGAKKG